MWVVIVVGSLIVVTIFLDWAVNVAKHPLTGVEVPETTLGKPATTSTSTGQVEEKYQGVPAAPLIKP